jgi:hypothetical protein
MSLYAFHDLTLELTDNSRDRRVDLGEFLEGLSWVKAPQPTPSASLHFWIRFANSPLSAPWTARELFRTDGFSALEHGKDFYLTDGSSLLRLQQDQGRAEASLMPCFFAKSPILQSNFWAFSLLKLLRALGLYSLHAAAVVASEGTSILIIGPSGSGKSTLAVGLIRQGWRYLSDDAVILRPQGAKIEALALRKHFYIDADAAPSSAEVPFGEVVPDTAGRLRRRAYVEEAYPGQRMEQCVPGVLVFSRIVPQAKSSLLPIRRLDALKHLLACSGPQLFDKDTMNPHLQVLKRLLQQTVAYELCAGLDLYRDPMILTRLLSDAEGARRWPAW